jgi:glycosyltransferase involved in cell wall biosynthesis
MKITYLHQYFTTPDMPGATRSYEMARRLVDMGHEVHMLTSWRKDKERWRPHSPADQKGWFVTLEDGIKVHWLPVHYSNRMTYNERMRAFLKFAFGSARRAATLDTDIVFATSTPLTIALPAVIAARRRKVPMVFEVRDLWPEMPIAVRALTNPLTIRAAKTLEAWAYHNAAAVVALSPGMQEGIVSTGYPGRKVTVIPNGSDNKEFAFDHEAAQRFRSARPWLGDRPLVIYAGTFGRLNGLDYAVELAGALWARGSDACLLLVGDGAERDSIVQKARQTGVYQNNLFVESRIPKRDIPALFSASSMAATFFVDVPEMRANSANKFFDSLASGKPVLLNYGGWMHDLVLQHGCGIAAWGLPVNDVAAELDRRLHDAQWLARAGAAARRLAESDFDRDLLAQRLEKLLVDVACHRQERP